MKNTLRLPVVEVLNEFEIKVNSKGSLLRLVVISILIQGVRVVDSKFSLFGG
jgi:hypothetical protein